MFSGFKNYFFRTLKEEKIMKKKITDLFQQKVIFGPAYYIILITRHINCFSRLLSFAN